MKKYLYTLLILIFTAMFCSESIAHEETLIIFDSSISMGNKIGGVPKYKLAADQIKKFMQTFPESKPIGLRMIGITINQNLANYLKNPSEMCEATQLLVPISTHNTTDIINGLSVFFPLGTTPLVYALDMSIKYDFSPAASIRHIILVTDGVDGCGENVCTYVTELRKQRNDVKIDIIALGVTVDELKELKCVSDNTSGTIVSVSNKEDMHNALVTFFTPTVKYSKPVVSKDIEYKNYLLEFNE